MHREKKQAVLLLSSSTAQSASEDALTRGFLNKVKEGA